MRGLHKTDIEEIMARALKENGIEATREFPIRCKYGYILDFAIVDLKIDIECDGEMIFRKRPIHGGLRDKKRNAILRKMGWKVERFWGEEIRKDIQSCIARIKETIKKEVKINGDV